jgi:glycosyltransferase involved in cell wall biosynthesis
MGPLRVLQVVPAYFPAVRYGGPIRSVHGLSRALIRRGHEVHVYTTNVDHDGVLDVPLNRDVDVEGVNVRYYGVPALRRIYWSPGLGQQLRHSVAAFDVVHLQSVFLWPTYAAARAAARADVPYVISPRGMLVPDLIRNRSRIAKTAWIRLIERQSLERAAAVHVTSELEAEELAKFGFRLADTVCIPNGVSWPDQITPRAGGPFGQVRTPYALFLSRICWKKGLDRLIHAWRQVPDLNLVIAGNDEEGYRAELEAMVDAYDLRSRVEFVGLASDEHKWALYRDAQLFVLPSYSENFGNVVAESMAMGCPVVVTPEVGLSSLVQESGCGVVTPGEPDQLADAIRRLHAEPGKRLQMGAAGVTTARDKLSWNAVAAAFEDMYQEVCMPTARTATAAKT